MSNITINANGFIQHPRVIQQPTSHGWNTRPERALNTIARIVIHHTVTGGRPTVRQFNDIWLGNRWNRSGYSLVIHDNGEIHQLASLRIPTWGAGIHNPTAIHIAFAGRFDGNRPQPTAAARESYGWLVRQLLNHSALPGVTGTQHVHGHGTLPQMATVCPGITNATLRNWIPVNTPPVNTPAVPNHTWTAGNLNRDVRVTADVLNIREQRNATSRQMGQLRRGDVVRITWVLGVDNANPINGAAWGSINGSPDRFINMNFVELLEQTRNHTVVSGDTLWGLSQRFNVSVADIQRLNNMGTSTTLTVGQVLRIPA